MTASPLTTPRPSISQQSAERRESGQSANGNAATSIPAASSPALGLPTALKPVGIVNEQNTCFLNSTFQALCATGPLISLLNSSPTGPIIPSPLSLLPSPIIPGSRIPALIPEAAEPPLYPLLPVTKTFLASLQKSWKMKDAGGGTSGSGETSSSRSMRLNHLLREMARKYDQYDDYMQQDAHELLRHLLDSMQMEEKDVIKRVQPPPPPDLSGKKKKKAKTANDGISPLPSPSPSAPTSPTKVKFSSNLTVDSDHSSKTDAEGTNVKPVEEVPEEERLVSFVDVLFGGLLASVVVCEHCKSVSHTYEGFLDVSLSLKGDIPRPRKRDKLKAAFGLKPRGSASRSSAPEQTNGLSHTSSVMSESELSDGEHPNVDRDRRKSLDQDDRKSDRTSISEDGSSLKRNTSMSQKFGLKGKASFGFGKKKSRAASSSSSIASTVDADRTPPATSIPGSPNTFHRQHGLGPTPAQNAYIQRILSAPQSGHTDDPLAKLRAANSGEGIAVNEKPGSKPLTGLEESLQAFTSVEVLEGDNAFACRKCWKIKTGKYANAHDTVHEEDETVDDDLVPPVFAPRPAPPSISIAGSDSSSDVAIPTPDSDRRLGRAGSATSRSSAASVQQRAPSPLRRLVEEQGDEALEKSYAVSTISAESSAVAELEQDVSDGLSDSSSSDDEPPPVDLPVGVRPKMPTRRKSLHFTMRRAFKRYLIAQAPEVLVFHFKRFKQTQKSGLTFTSFYDLKKMDDFVSFPETFDLSPYLAPNRNDYKLSPTPTGLRAPYMEWPSPEHGPETQEPVMYRLYALVVHLGSMIGGHYIAYVLVDPEVMSNTRADPSQADHSLAAGAGSMSIDDNEDGPRGRGDLGVNPDTARPHDMPKRDRRVWCYCSDTTVRLASLEEVLAAKAYICFYEKIPAGK